MKIVRGTNHGGRGKTQQEQGQRERGGEQEKELQGDELADERGSSKSQVHFTEDLLFLLPVVDTILKTGILGSGLEVREGHCSLTRLSSWGRLAGKFSRLALPTKGTGM